MKERVSREQVIARLREADFRFNRQGERVDIYRQAGTSQRVNVPRRDLLPLKLVCIILKQAGLKNLEIEKFCRESVKTNTH